MKKLVKTLSLAALGICCTMAKAQHEYVVEVNSKNSVHVKATLKMNNNELYMPIMTTQKLPDGPAQLLENLKFATKDGESIGISGTKNEGNYYVWQLDKNVEELSLSYDINMIHDQFDWPFGWRKSHIERMKAL